MSLASAVARLAKPIVVTRRAAGAIGSDGRFTPGSTSTATVRMTIQPETSRPTELARGLTGDRTTGEVKVFVTDSALSAAGWTELRIAPPEDSSGPPGDRFAWSGREWEITELKNWTLAASAGFRHYVAQERGSSS